MVVSAMLFKTDPYEIIDFAEVTSAKKSPPSRISWESLLRRYAMEKCPSGRWHEKAVQHALPCIRRTHAFVKE